MKNPPYKEIIDLNAERKEYSRLCNGKSRIFKLYTEWEDYIKRLLSGFNSPKDLYNFKHYCINAARAQEKSTGNVFGIYRPDDSALFGCHLGRNACIYYAILSCRNTCLCNNTKQETCKRKLLF